MANKQYGKYPRHRKNPWYVKRQFIGLSALSLSMVFLIALLSRAELRLSGETLASDGHELAVMDQLRPFESVELMRERPDLRLYLLKRDDEEFLAHVRKSEDGEWNVDKIERIHSAARLRRRLKE